MSQIRHPAVAGLFYPDKPDILTRNIQGYLDAAPDPVAIPKALIVPHAGYVYSGPVAASAYRHLYGLRDRIRTVVLLGPAHRVGFLGLAVPNSEAFETPLGVIPIDRRSIDRIIGLRQVVALDAAHQQEHSLEVQLPFLQVLLDDFNLVPLVVGDAEAGEVAEVLEQLWGGDETLVVISSDLSHYHDYQAARRIDQATSDAIVNLHPEKIGYDQACGRSPINGLLTLARQKNLTVEVVDLRNSGDTAGSKDQVVGYGAYVVH